MTARLRTGQDGACRVVIAGGGTGGHLYPGIAIARELLARAGPDATVTFVGTARGLEAKVVPREGFELDLLRSAGLKGRAGLAVMKGVALLPVSFADAWRILSRRRPRLVIGVGGYSSGARRLRRGAAADSDAARRAERGAGIDQPVVVMGGERGGGDVRIVGVLLRQEGICRRQPGSSGVFYSERDAA